MDSYGFACPPLLESWTCTGTGSPRYEGLTTAWQRPLDIPRVPPRSQERRCVAGVERTQEPQRQRRVARTGH
jgi:hypothetical protein